MATQEQALNIRSIEDRVYHTRQDPRCRLCKNVHETMQPRQQGERCSQVRHTWSITTSQLAKCTETYMLLQTLNSRRHGQHLQRGLRMSEPRSCGISRRRGQYYKILISQVIATLERRNTRSTRRNTKGRKRSWKGFVEWRHQDRNPSLERRKKTSDRG